MKSTRYEILLPLCYNDGRAIEAQKFDQTNLERIERFSATTTDLTQALGTWLYRGTVFEDRLLRIIIDVPASASANDFFRRYKETLKTRFEQIDIWISCHEIEIL
ncbi:MAG TPA: hypothetical protein VG028_12350 [Terriglobia bacterium]|nr:hypothetical protein [Terriglobia bacterium]